jgi:hypothetical protein
LATIFDFGLLVCSESFRSLLLRGRNFLALIGELPAHRRGRLPQSARTRRMSLSVRHLEKRLRLF